MVGKEIDKAKGDEYQRNNAGLFAAAEARFDQQVQANAQALRESEQRLARYETEAAALRRVLVDPVPDAPELKLALTVLGRAEEGQESAAKELADAQSFSTNELAGIIIAPGNSGKSGEGPVRNAAKERVATAQFRADAQRRSVADARQRLRETEAKVSSTADTKRRQAEANLERITQALPEEKSRFERLDDEQRRPTANREQIIRRAVDRDPSRVPEQDGFLARLKILHTLTSEPMTLVVVVLIDLALFGVELAAVIAKIASFVPTTYATKLALLDYGDFVTAATALIAMSPAPRPPAAAPIEQNPPGDAGDTRESRHR